MNAMSWIKTSAVEAAKKAGIAAIIVTVVGYWFAYQDRIDSRQEHAWNVIRVAVDWSEKKKWGNVGQIEAFETLTRDCDPWWRDTPLHYVLDFFFRDCVSLKSLPLMQMDFGGLNAAGADLSHGYFACGNFAGAKLMRTHLENTAFMASDLSGADLSGAHLSDACLFYADISAATLSDDTDVNPETLRQACVKQEEKGGKLVRRDIITKSQKFSQVASQIPLCPEDKNRCGLLEAVKGWSCGK
jgi:Pentapeptide repeats (8 copies)